MSPTGSYVEWFPSPSLVVLFWKVLEALGNRPWPEEIGSYEYAFEGYTYALASSTSCPP